MATLRKKGTAKVAKGKSAKRSKAAEPHRRRAIAVVFGKTTTKRIRFKLPSGKWSPSYANRGAARRGARRIYKARITSQAAA